MTVDITNVDTCEKERLNEAVSKSYQINLPLSVTCVEDVYVLPIKRNNWQYLGGVMNKKGDILPSSTCFDYPDGGYDFKDPLISSDTIIYVGCFQSVWGHILTDNIKKLWFLKTEEGQSLVRNGAKICYTTIQGEPIGDSVWNLLKLLGFSKDLFFEIKIVTCYKCVYIPDSQFVFAENMRFFHPEFIELYRDIKKNVKLLISGKPTTTYERLYFTRRKSTSFWREMGEHYFEKIFMDLGFQIIAPETLSLETQIWLLMNCKEFATTEGSISHNAIFCSPGTKVIILRKSNFINQYQLPINEMAQLNVVYIDAHHSTNLNPVVPVAGPFYMCVNRNVESFLGKRVFHRPYWMHFSWLLYCNRHRLQRWSQYIRRHF